MSKNSYNKTANQIIEAGNRWFAVFPARVTLKLPPRHVAVLSELEPAIELVAGDDVTKRFLHAVDDASKHAGTIMMLVVAVEFWPRDRVRVIELPLSTFLRQAKPS